MKNNKRKKRIVLVVLLALLAVTGVISAALTTDLFGVSWWSADGGGAQGMSGGEFTLSGSIGQPDAGKMTGGDFTLTGGFWRQPPPTRLTPATAQDWAQYR